MHIIKTKIIKPDMWHREARYAADQVKHGAVIVFPTETVYGIGAHPQQPAAVQRVYELKGRSIDKPLQLLIGDKEIVHHYVNEMPVAARKLMRRYWPGPLTMVFPRRGETIGLRMPNHAVALKLIKLCGGALYATSANMSGFPDTDDFACARALFNHKANIIIDGGECEIGAPSSVVMFEGEKMRILREGALKKEEIIEAAY